MIIKTLFRNSETVRVFFFHRLSIMTFYHNSWEIYNIGHGLMKHFVHAFFEQKW